MCVVDVGSLDGTEEPRSTLALHGVEPLLGQRSILHNNHHNVEAEQISLVDLPASFHDAVLVMRALNCRYLWIDSLSVAPLLPLAPSPQTPNSPSCIIQDGPNDWMREAAPMGAIFQNAHLTLSATSAKNSKKGFLHPRRPRFHPPTLRHSSPRPRSPDGGAAVVAADAGRERGRAGEPAGRARVGAAGAAAGASDTAFRARAAVLGVSWVQAP